MSKPMKSESQWAPRYELAPEDVSALGKKVMLDNHPALAKVNLRVDYVFAHAPVDKSGSPTGPAVKQRRSRRPRCS